jgi:hypothetical protein
LNSRFFFLVFLIVENNSQYVERVHGKTRQIFFFAYFPLLFLSSSRTLLLGSALGMIGSIVLVTVALILKDGDMFLSGPVCDMVALTAMVLFVSFFELGLGPIPWLIGAEIFPGHRFVFFFEE